MHSTKEIHQYVWVNRNLLHYTAELLQIIRKNVPYRYYVL